jgi:Tfp pilus assembly protein PilF
MDSAQTLELAVQYHQAGNLGEAEKLYRQVLQAQPRHPDALHLLGVIAHQAGRREQAIDLMQSALRERPNFAEAQCNLGCVRLEMGDLASAEQTFRAAVRTDPRHARAQGFLASLLHGKLPADERAMLERRLADSDLDDSSRASLHFSLAQVCDARGEYEQAAAHMRQANALALTVYHRLGKRYERDQHARFIDFLMSAFTTEFFERVRGFGLETERPVFIVGLPRSGTTLTEQILAAHSQVFGAGELTLGRDVFLVLDPQPTEQGLLAALSGMQCDTVRRAAQWHLDQLNSLNSTAARVVDKLPENCLYLGLLAVLFPRGKFIHCRRDLRDVGLSCWMTNFTQLDWANDLDDIAGRFRGYLRIMEHWRRVLPVPMLDVRYEETVADLPGTARRIVEWCGLNWEPACLDFHEAVRPIRTASAIQVRKPIYTGSVGRWRHYERELRAWFATLNS